MQSLYLGACKICNKLFALKTLASYLVEISQLRWMFFFFFFLFLFPYSALCSINFCELNKVSQRNELKNFIANCKIFIQHQNNWNQHFFFFFFFRVNIWNFWLVYFKHQMDTPPPPPRGKKKENAVNKTSHLKEPFVLRKTVLISGTCNPIFLYPPTISM